MSDKKKSFSFEEFKEKNTHSEGNSDNSSAENSELNKEKNKPEEKINTFKGKILKLYEKKKFGFIKNDNGDIYFSFKNLKDTKEITINDEVEYQIGINKKNNKPEAINVKLIGAQNADRKGICDNKNIETIIKSFYPKDTFEIINAKPKIDNFALLFYKFVNFEIDKKRNYKFILNKDKVSKFDFSKSEIDRILNVQKCALNTLFNKDKIVSLDIKNNWRMVIGLGTESVYETSMTLHPVYGIPYIPGQAIKGTLRSYIINEFYESKEEKALKESVAFCKIFGCPKNVKDNRKSALDRDYQGSVIFFDAFPIEFDSQNFKWDIMNPHYEPYYSKNLPPADYYEPIPIYFLTLENVTFRFSFGIKNNKDFIMKDDKIGSGNLKEIIEIHLKNALKYQGIGAKTAVGYGYF